MRCRLHRRRLRPGPGAVVSGSLARKPTVGDRFAVAGRAMGGGALRAPCPHHV